MEPWEGRVWEMACQVSLLHKQGVGGTFFGEGGASHDIPNSMTSHESYVIMLGTSCGDALVLGIGKWHQSIDLCQKKQIIPLAMKSGDP